jgi:hypothetical protein
MQRDGQGWPLPGTTSPSIPLHLEREAAHSPCFATPSSRSMVVANPDAKRSADGPLLLERVGVRSPTAAKATAVCHDERNYQPHKSATQQKPNSSISAGPKKDSHKDCLKKLVHVAKQALCISKRPFRGFGVSYTASALILFACFFRSSSSRITLRMRMLFGVTSMHSSC